MRLSGFVGRLFFRVDGVELAFGMMFSKCPSHLPDIGHVPIGRAVAASLKGSSPYFFAPILETCGLVDEYFDFGFGC